MYPIEPVQKRYAWGSHTRLQDMFGLPLGRAMDGDGVLADTLAEMWFSGHPQSPSTLRLPDGGGLPLTQAIQRDPQGMVGQEDSEDFGPVLPYLFKVISARIPLSLQVHPLDFEARAGFNRENAAGVPLSAPERSFKDTLAKNEMVVALEPFTASVGFAPISTQLQILRVVDHPVAQRMVDALVTHRFRRGTTPAGFAQADAMMPVSSLAWPDSRRRVFRAFYTAVSAQAGDAGELTPALLDADRRIHSRKAHDAIVNALQAAQAFPGDPSVLALLMMNAVCLDEGESVYIPAGTPHAYIHGAAAEIMTNSDNVLRAGMTPKHKDLANLLHSLDCQPASPIDPSSSMIATLAMHNMVTYRPHISEYMLVYGYMEPGSATWPLMSRIVDRYGDLVQRFGPRRLLLPQAGPRVLVCVEGSVRVRGQNQDLTLNHGQSLFIRSDDGPVDIVRPEPGGSTLDGSPADDHGSFLMASTPR
ncbi:mannose-6-phosphate isomerase [Bifidobacterium actinocoloniiforme DSM 22766]|uniref:mannose-6-phosphate isomerase n=1 Tax=Bifidobacterium actinocoloniiforme DSM 22766 TaxID=1437605 RepID=A0A086Z1Q8_9BIFI|nr:mannose-6-phosphate isomerase, class I [Bifidobacterium actinocoloniiforme]AKV55573.1 mannose-6-phosphate isomerase [Bifidobacterium actinocoloniiforme DSM 22766]KFI40458.1 mannose-6-phosphate isomerase [Bifidobacterium actinocoloniiforme DSM 22766]